MSKPATIKKIVITYVFIHVFVTLTYMWLFLDRFSLPPSTLSKHLLVLVTIHLIFYWLLKLGPRHLAWRLLMAIVGSSYWYYLLLLYALNWFSNLNWGSNVLFDFIVHLPQQIHSIATTEGISLFWVVLAIISVWLIFITLAWYLILRLEPAMNEQSVKLKPVVYSFLFMVFVLFYVYLTYSRDDPRSWVFEPVLSSISLNSSVYRNNRSKMQALKDKQVKANFDVELAGFNGKTNVILIIADALRADRLPSYGYAKPTTPFLSTLQQNDPAFQQVDYFTSTCSESICGIYSILSSRQYANIGFDLYGLSEVLKSAGYTKNFILSSNHNYNALNKLYGREFDYYADGNDFKPHHTLHDDEGVIRSLDNIPNFQEQPAFFYIHLMSSHSLGKNKTPFNRYLPFIEHVPGFAGKEVTEDLDRLSDQLANAYDNGILQLDDYIRRIFESLDNKGYLEDSLVIITGDHGDGLGERGYFFHTYNLFHEDINVPLIWYTSKCQLKNTRYGTHIDVAPSVLDCLGIPIPDTWQGKSLLTDYQEERITIHQTLREEKTIMVMLETRNHLYKLMATMYEGVISNYRLFDYYMDPAEKNNMIDEANPSLVAELKAVLEQHFQ